MKVIKVPFKNSKECWHEGITNGTEEAPDTIVKTLSKDVWLNESGKGIDPAFLTVAEIKNDIYKEAKNILEEARKKQEKIIFIGGDHSCSFPLFKAFSECYQNAGLVIFDAHPDCMKPHKNPNHEEWLRATIESGISPEKIILVGTRASCMEEENFLRLQKINLFTCKEIFGNIEEACNNVMEEARKFDALYIGIDIDVVDPSAAPGTGYIEPAGLSARELLYFLQRLRLLKNFCVADIVEINPKKDINNQTIKLGAKIIAELL